KYGTPYKVNVTKASPSGQYIKNNLVTITANDPDEYFEFKEWEGTEGLNFADGTSKTSAEIKFTMPARDLNLTATYKDTRFNLTVISGKGNGLYVPGSIVSVTANAPKANFKLKEWEGTEGLTFIGGTSKTKPEIQFNMPSKDLTLTAIYEDVLFIVQPQDKTGYVGENINFDWELADYSGSVYFVFRQIYEDGEWKHDSMALGDPYKEPGPHTSSVRSNTAGSKTYRLHYYLGTAIYSDPFTITWEEALIATGNIQGYASWGKVGDDSGIKVTAKEGDTTIAETHTGTDGGFELSLDAGIYDIVLSKSGYLERKISNVVVIQDLPTNLANNDNPISLLAGDINGDKSINANDLSVLLAAFNKTTSDAGYNEAADLNGDGSINANDLSMLLSNFNKTASDYPEWILP
ncbi:MAG TPA: dockerin type I domain-containing protein, partial [Tissierellaceae bacterium]|nr:dockerin type I domain-containing protein [Tissierellaceae bacterium]